MATNKNFTMQQYNGTDYDVLYPKNTSQQTLLNDSTLATALGITATNPEIDQALTEIVSKITALENGAVKIQTGSYVGTGTYGSSNPCSLTFDFAPKIVFILPTANMPMYTTYGMCNAIWVEQQAKFGSAIYVDSSRGVEFKTCTCSLSNTKMSWYTDDTTSANLARYYQLNYSNQTYYWCAIGK